MIETAISDGELARRWDAMRRVMEERQIDVLVMQNNNDWLGGYVKWFTDIPAMNAYPRTVLFFAADPMTVIEMGPFEGRRVLDGLDPIHRGVGEIFTAPSFGSVSYTSAYDAQFAVSVLRQRGCRRIGLLGAGNIPHGFMHVLQDGLAGHANFIDATEWVDAIKAIKSEEEITLIRCAAAMQDKAFAAMLTGIRPGLRDCDVAAIAWSACQKRGSEQGIVLGSSAPQGRASVFVGRHMQGRELAAGDHLSILIETNGPGGFYTEMARTIVLGQAPSEIKDGFAAMKAAQDATLNRLKPGVSCREIAVAHDDYMQAHHFPKEARLYAHGQGYDMVERPLIRHDETMALAENMCLAVHPGYQTDALFAVICDNYLIGPSGPSGCLHATAKQVFEVF